MCIPRGFYNSCKFVLAASLFSFCAALASPAQQIDLNENGEDEDLQAARSQWFYEQRAYPQGYIPSGARLNALQQMDRAPSGAGFGTRWALVGPRPESIPDNAPPFLGTANVSGRVTALALDPRGSIYLGSAVGGAWKSYNRGTVWLPLMSQQESLAIGSLALDPNTPNIVYAGTGENEFGAPSYYGAGILKTDTGGFFWTLLGQDVFGGPFGAASDQGGAYIAAAAVSHKDGDILLAAVTFFDDDAHSGIYRSTDGGATWSDDPLNPRKPVLAGAAGCEVFFDRRDATGNTVYAALGTPNGSGKNGIYVSKDAGQTWTAVGGRGLPGGQGWFAMAMSQQPSPKTIIYASIGDAFKSSRTLNGVFRSEDGGATWQRRFPEGDDFCQPQCFFDNVVAVSPTDADVVAVGGSFNYGLAGSSGEAVSLSADGGKNWRKITKGKNGINVHADVHAILFSGDGRTLFVGSDGGMWRSDNFLAEALPNWTELNRTLSITQFYPGLSIQPNNSLLSLGGSQDNGTSSYKGTSRWGYEFCADGSWTAMDAKTDPLTAYAACAGNRIQIGKSTLQGGSFGPWANKTNGITGMQPNFLPPLIPDSTVADVLYYGTNAVWQTTNGAEQWKAVSPSLIGMGESLSTLALGDKENEKTTLLAGTSRGRLWITKDVKVGAEWNRIDTGLPNRALTQIVVKTNDVQTPAYTTFSGFSRFTTTDGNPGGDGKGHVFRASLETPTITWTDISQGPFGLPDVPVNDIILDPDLCNTFYVATDIGVFYTADNGLRWQPLPTGLPRTVVMSLKLNEQARILRAATHGFSAWDLSVPNTTVSGVLLQPVSRNFGQRKVGTLGPKTVFVLSSNCLARKPFKISSINVSSNDFVIEKGENSCQLFVDTTFCVIYVAFSPRSVGNISGLLTITDSALGSPRSSALSGVGTQ